ncbi:MAG: SH3 domain-containing protein [Clostridia bacterium]|nr:SH3 domain-containing protein [Clostridia bacterium]
MPLNNFYKQFLATGYLEQIEKVYQTLGLASRINIETLHETAFSRFLRQQNFMSNILINTELASKFSYVEKIAKLVPNIEHIQLPNAAIFSEAQKALEIINTPAISAAISNVNKVESVIPKHLDSILKNHIPMLERINFNNSQLSSIVSSLNTYQDLFQNIANISGYNNLLENIFPKDGFANFNDKDIEIEEVSLTAMEEEELANDLTDIFDSSNWQQKLDATIIKWQEKNPIVMRIIKAVITLIVFINTLVSIASFMYQATIVSDKAAIRQNPSKTAPIVNTVTKNEIVTIISEEKYWYQIKYEHIEAEDTDKKVIYKGYLSKRTTVRTIETKSISTTEDDALDNKKKDD